MKKLLLAGISLLSFGSAKAQSTSGKIYYNETIKMNIQIKEDDMKGSGMSPDQLSALLPKEHTSKKVLYYNTDAALYDEVKQEATDATAQQNGHMRMMINVSNGDAKTYRDLKENKLIEQQDFMSRKFLVTSEPKKTEWKMTGKQKEILGYPCQQATTMRDTTLVTAWFTPAIPVPAGPRGAGGLPGMILEMELGKQFAIVATKVEPGAINDKLLAKPTEGKKVSKEQYDKIVADKMKEMGAEGGGSGNVIIRHEIRH